MSKKAESKNVFLYFLHSFLHILISIFLVASLTPAQTVDQTNRGSGSVNPTSLGMEMAVNLANYSGRQINLSVNLKYSSKLWRLENAGHSPTNTNRCNRYADPVYSENSASGWSSSLDRPVIEYTGKRDIYDERGNIWGGNLCDPTSTGTVDNSYVKRVLIRMPGGAAQEFRASDEPEFYRSDSNCDDNNPNTPCPANLPSIQANWDRTYYSTDGSGMKYVEDSSTGTHRLWMTNGSYYDFGSSEYIEDLELRKGIKLTDVNGNQIVFQNDQPSTYPNGYWKDTMGREIPIPFVPKTPTQTSIQNYQLPGISTAYKIYWKKLEDSLLLPGQQLYYAGDSDQSFNSYSPHLFETKRIGNTPDYLYPLAQYENGQAIRFNPVVLAKVELPNGKFYEFKYNVFGEIEKIIYPSGSEEKFEYQAIPPLGRITNAYDQANRGVKKREISEKSSVSPIVWLYNAAANGNGYEIKTTNPDGTWSKKLVHRSNTNINYYGWGTWGYDKILAGYIYEELSYSADNVLLARNLTNWQVTQGWLNNDGTIAERQPRVTHQQSFIYDNGGNGVSSVTKFEYFGDLGQRETTVLTKKITSYDYVPLIGGASAVPSPNPEGTPDPEPSPVPTPAPATPVLVKELEYLETDASISPTLKQAYKEKNIIGRATKVKLLNPNNLSEVFNETQFVYDEGGNYSIIDYGSTVGYLSPIGTNANLRGNPTSVRNWNKDANSWIETHTQYDNFGNARKIWDSTGDVSTYNETYYDPIYKYAYATKITTPAPDPTGQHGTNGSSEVTKTFDFTTGLLLSATDTNGQTSSIEYDSSFRPVKITPPAGSIITEKIYNDSANDLWVKVRRQIDENNWAEQTTFFDNLGRPFKTRIKDLQGDVYNEVKFDAIGRVEKISNKYRQGEQILWSKARYDNAGRFVEAYAPAAENQTGSSLGTIDFGVSTTSNFIGTYVVTTDASGRKNRVISGIRGISRVDEAINIGGTIDNDLGSIDTPLQPTFYTYNVKGELIKITQGNPSQPNQPIQNRYFMYDSLGRLVRVRQPEQIPNANLATTGNPENNQWTAGYSYNILGNIIKVTDAKGINIINEYDKAGRPTTRCYSKPNIQTTASLCSQLSSLDFSLDTSQVDYYYDGKGLSQTSQFSKGKLTKVKNNVSETIFNSFDNHGRLLTSQQITDGNIYDFSYKYNLSGGLIEETYPSKRIVKNFLDADGGLAAVSSKILNGQFKTYASNFDYSAMGTVNKMMLGNGLWETAQFNERSQVTQIGLGNSATDTSIWKEVYEYGELSANGTTVNTAKNTGNIARKTTTVPTTSFIQTYRYDALERLTEARETNSSETENWKQTFGYDRFGNRTGFSHSVAGSQLPINNINHPTIDPSNNRFTTGQGYVYDYNGNLIQDPEGKTFTFNGDDKQIEVKNSNQQPLGKYFYDGNGNRIKKVTNTETTVFVYDAGGTLAAEYSTQLNPNPTVNYLTGDRLGSQRVITDKNKNVISRRDFMPFGDELYAGNGGRTEALKYSLSGVDNIRQRFTGYEKDAETGLDFAQARMYQNYHGRFTTVDPLMGSSTATNPQTFNRYTYTGNNPIKYTDPTGLLYYRNTQTGEVNWYDQDPGGDWKEVTGETRVATKGGCIKNQCVNAGDIVIFGEKSMTIIRNPTQEQTAVANGENVVNEVVNVISEDSTDIINVQGTTGASSPGNSLIGNNLAFAPTLDPVVTNPIDIGTGTGGGPLEKPGGSGSPDSGSGSDTGGETGGGDTDVGADGDWKVTLAKWAYFIAMYNIKNWENGDDSPDDTEYDVLYRGVTNGHPGYENALNGTAIPRGGNATPRQHNEDDDTRSPYTSWTTRRGVAVYWANRNIGGGVVLEAKIPKSRQVKSPDVYDEGEVLVTGIVTGAKVTKP